MRWGRAGVAGSEPAPAGSLRVHVEEQPRSAAVCLRSKGSSCTPTLQTTACPPPRQTRTPTGQKIWVTATLGHRLTADAHICVCRWRAGCVFPFTRSTEGNVPNRSTLIFFPPLHFLEELFHLFHFIISHLYLIAGISTDPVSSLL